MTTDFKGDALGTNVENGFESDRFIEKVLFGRIYTEAPVITSRICGDCSVAHHLTSIKAVEDAGRIIPSKQTRDLRKLMLMGQMIWSHTGYLYKSIIPAFTGEDSVFDLKRSHLPVFKNAAILKNYSDKILETFAGRTIHPVASIPGGFSSYPAKAKVKELLEEYEEVLKSAEETLGIISSFEFPKMKSGTLDCALHQKNEYAIYEAEEIWTSEGKYFTPLSYEKKIIEELRPRTRVRTATLAGESIHAGALSRIKLNRPVEITEIGKELGIEVCENNPFSNITAKALEIYYFVIQSAVLIGQLLEAGIKIEPLNQPQRFGVGMAVCESPDGILLHHCELDGNGFIQKYNIVTPANLNISALECDNKTLAQTMKGKKDLEKEDLMRLLSLSYNICKPCALH